MQDPGDLALAFTGADAIWQPTPGYCDQARKIDIDWVGMRTEAGSRAGAEWDLVHTWTKGVPWSAWAEVCGKFADDVDVARHHYWSQPAIEAIRKGQQTVPPERRRWDIDDAWSGRREEYVARAEANAGVTYAVLFHGAWVQSDMVDQEASQNWNERFHAILDLVPDAAMVTIVDYHV